MDGDWSFMGSQEPGQEWDTARRYQLAHMTYAAGAAYYHHMPAMRLMFKQLFEKLINKMLNKEVWDYWYLTSQSGKRMDPDLKELRKPWVDAVCKENIMVDFFFHFMPWVVILRFVIVFRPSAVHDLALHHALP